MTTYNVGELEDLIAAKDTELQNETAMYAGFAPKWVNLDAPSFEAWTLQWATVQENYATARDAAQTEISEAKIGYALDDLMDATWYRNADATDEYNGILSALNPSFASNTPAPGSLDDLDARLRAAQIAQGITPPAGLAIPQPENPTSGLNPTSWQGYMTGLGVKLGLVDPAKVPAGTPGTGKGAPPLIPTWIKWGTGIALGTYVLKTAKDIIT